MSSQNEEPAHVLKSVQSLREKTDQSRLDTLARRVDYLNAYLLDVKSEITTVVSGRSMQRQTVYPLLVALEHLQTEVQSIQRSLLAVIAPSSSSTRELPESFTLPHTETAEDWEC
jgi:hypothetical protein